MFFKKLRWFVHTKVFEYFIILCIVVNIIIMASEHYKQPKWLEKLQDTSNLVFNIIFTIEAVLKILAFGPYGYVRV